MQAEPELHCVLGKSREDEDCFYLTGVFGNTIEQTNQLLLHIVQPATGNSPFPLNDGYSLCL
jgi:hypothetical protein